MRRASGFAIGVLTIPLLLGGPVHGAAKVEQKTKTELTGALGMAARTFGGKAAREGTVATMAVQGDRMMIRSEDAGQLLDLAGEKIYTIDFGERAYRVMTFAEMRQAMQDAAEALKQNPMLGRPPQPGQEVDVEVDVHVQESDRYETIAGYDCRQVVTEIVARPKGKTLEAGGGVVVTLDDCLGPRIPAMDELQAFSARYANAMQLESLVDPQAAMQLVQVIAGSPMVKKAMAELQEHRAALAGTPVRSSLTIETVAGTEPIAASGEAPPSPGKLLGGLGKMLKRKGNDTASGETGRSKLAATHSELISVASTVSAADVALPEGFKKKGE